jgi:hypothetical protein
MNWKTMMVGGMLLGSTVAFAGPRLDGRGARTSVLQRIESEGRSTSGVRVHALQSDGRIVTSRSGKSIKVLVQRADKTVEPMNMLRSNKVASRGHTGLVSQGEANLGANLKLRREPGVQSNKKQPGSFSGTNDSGLSQRGNTFRINSATDRNETVFIAPRTGKAATRIDR